MFHPHARTSVIESPIDGTFIVCFSRTIFVAETKFLRVVVVVVVVVAVVIGDNIMFFLVLSAVVDIIRRKRRPTTTAPPFPRDPIIM